jgi:hypothetical protein
MRILFDPSTAARVKRLPEGADRWREISFFAKTSFAY